MSSTGCANPETSLRAHMGLLRGSAPDQHLPRVATRRQPLRSLGRDLKLGLLDSHTRLPQDAAPLSLRSWFPTLDTHPVLLRIASKAATPGPLPGLEPGPATVVALLALLMTALSLGRCGGTEPQSSETGARPCQHGYFLHCCRSPMAPPPPTHTPSVPPLWLPGPWPSLLSHLSLLSSPPHPIQPSHTGRWVCPFLEPQCSFPFPGVVFLLSLAKSYLSFKPQLSYHLLQEAFLIPPD